VMEGTRSVMEGTRSVMEGLCAARVNGGRKRKPRAYQPIVPGPPLKGPTTESVIHPP